MNYHVCHDKFNLLERPASKVVGLTSGEVPSLLGSMKALMDSVTG